MKTFWICRECGMLLPKSEYIPPPINTPLKNDPYHICGFARIFPDTVIYHEKVVRFYVPQEVRNELSR